MEYQSNVTDPVNSVTGVLNASFSEQFNADELLEKYMGEKRRDLASVGVLTFVYVVIFLTGMVGNVCTCVVIAKNAFMHTATNYYLFSLAVSDMLTLIFGKFRSLFVCLSSFLPVFQPF